MSRRTMIFSGDPFAFDGQCVSVDFNGSDESMNSSDIDVGIADSWSVSTWLKRDGSQAGDDIWFTLSENGGGNLDNQMRLNSDADVAGQLQVTNWNSAGTIIKNQFWNGAIDDDVWTHIVVVRDGAGDTITVYKNGVDQGAPDVNTTDLTGTMANTDREVWIGSRDTGANPFLGLLHSVGVWSVELTQDSVDALYNGGDASPVDWANDSGAYTQSAGLEHWWRLGFDSDAIGADYGNSATDITVTGGNIDATDIVNDAPGVSCA